MNDRDALVNEIAPKVAEKHQADSIGVDEFEVTDDLTGIDSLPAVKKIGGIEQIVQVRLDPLLSPLKDGAKVIAAAEKATSDSKNQSAAAKNAADEANAARENIEGDLAGKADLAGTGYVTPFQIDPLQQRQTGIIGFPNGVRGYYRQKKKEGNPTLGRTLEFLVDAIFPIKTGAGCIYYAQYETHYNSGFVLQTANSGERFYFRFMGSEGFVGGNLKSGTHHIVCVMSECEETSLSELTVFIDGVCAGTMEGNTDFDLSNRPAYLCTFSEGYQSVTGYGYPIRRVREFDTAITSEQAVALFNNGRPQDYTLQSYENCTVELLPGSVVLTDGPNTGVWRDTSGKKNDFEQVGVIERLLLSPEDLSEVYMDTGLFYTDISTAYKLLLIPRGYAVTDVFIRNNNPRDLTSVVLRRDGTTENPVLWGITVPFGAGRYRGAWQRFLISHYIIEINRSEQVLVLFAHGNTPDGGMQVKLKLKYIGE